MTSENQTLTKNAKIHFLKMRVKNMSSWVFIERPKNTCFTRIGKKVPNWVCVECHKIACFTHEEQKCANLGCLSNVPKTHVACNYETSVELGFLRMPKNHISRPYGKKVPSLICIKCPKKHMLHAFGNIACQIGFHKSHYGTNMCRAWFDRADFQNRSAVVTTNASFSETI